MARARVGIAESAARGLLPNRQYDPRQATAGDMGGQLGQVIEQSATIADQAAQYFQAEQVQLQGFKNEKAFLDFSDAEANRIDEEGRQLTGAADGFTKNTMTGFDQGAAAFLETVPARQRPAWEVRVAQTRSKYAAGALGRELEQRQVFYKGQVGDGLKTKTRQIGEDPAGYEQRLAEGDALIAASGLDAGQKEQLTRGWRTEAADAYAIGLYQKDGPDGLLKALGGSTTREGDYDLSGATSTAEKDAAAHFKAAGFPNVAVAGMVGVLSWESGGLNPNGRNKGDGAAGDDSIGYGQWNGARAAALKKFAADRGKPWNDRGVQLDFVIHELKTGGPDERAAYRKLMSANTVAEAVAAMSDYERPQGWRRGGDPEAVIHWKERNERATRIAGKAATETTPGSGITDPRLAALPLDRVVQLRDMAERGIKQENAAQAQADQQQHNDWLDSFLLDLKDGKKGASDIQSAREAGQLTDFNEVSTAENVVKQRAAQVSSSGALAAALNTTDYAWNPVDKDQKEMVNKGVDGMVAGGTYTTKAGIEIFQRTGIMPEKTGNELRGLLLSNDPTKVKAGAAISANLLAENPNAFASMGDGRGDVEKAAVEYDRLIGLGYDADYAAGRVAVMNDPRRRSEVVAKEDDAKGFAAELRKGDATFNLIGTMTLNKEFGSDWSPQGDRHFTLGDAKQRAAIVSDYNEIAIEHFKQYGDRAAARHFAQQQMHKLYGLENGVLIKYPATKAYPAINGSTDYVHQQAAGDIIAITGKKVEADDVILIPVPRITAEAFRNGRPPPYQVYYRDRTQGKPWVIEMLPGRVFVADVPGAKKEGTARARAEYEASMKRKKSFENIMAMQAGAAY